MPLAKYGVVVYHNVIHILIPYEMKKDTLLQSIDAADIAARLRTFVADRAWEQYHTPKNIAMALTVEAAELLEQFQWLTPEQSLSLSSETRQAVSDELADILVYLIRMADVLGIDLSAAVTHKMAENVRKYPADKVRGSAKKYTAYEETP